MRSVRENLENERMPRVDSFTPILLLVASGSIAVENAICSGYKHDKKYDWFRQK